MAVGPCSVACHEAPDTGRNAQRPGCARMPRSSSCALGPVSGAHAPGRRACKEPQCHSTGNRRTPSNERRTHAYAAVATHARGRQRSGHPRTDFSALQAAGHHDAGHVSPRTSLAASGPGRRAACGRSWRRRRRDACLLESHADRARAWGVRAQKLPQRQNALAWQGSSRLSCEKKKWGRKRGCLLYTSPSPRD